MNEMPPEHTPLDDTDNIAAVLSFELPADENALNPEELSDQDIVDGFLAESTHMMSARSPKDVASIVNRLLNDRNQHDSNELQAHWREQTLVRIRESEKQVTEDDLYEDSIVLAIIERLKATLVGAEDYEEERHALRQLIDVRSIVLANPDSISEEDEGRWVKLVDKLYHQETIA